MQIKSEKIIKMKCYQNKYFFRNEKNAIVIINMIDIVENRNDTEQKLTRIKYEKNEINIYRERRMTITWVNSITETLT